MWSDENAFCFALSYTEKVIDGPIRFVLSYDQPVFFPQKRTPIVLVLYKLASPGISAPLPAIQCFPGKKRDSRLLLYL